MAACHALLDADPRYVDHATVHTGLGRIYLQTERYDEASASFGQAIALRPDWATGYYGRAKANFSKGDFVAARADLYHALQLDPRDYDVWLLRARAFLMEGNYLGAMSDVDVLLSGDTDRHRLAQGYVLRAEILGVQENYPAAWQAASRAQELDPENDDAFDLAMSIRSHMDD